MNAVPIVFSRVGDALNERAGWTTIVLSGGPAGDKDGNVMYYV